MPAVMGLMKARGSASAGDGSVVDNEGGGGDGRDKGEHEGGVVAGGLGNGGGGNGANSGGGNSGATAAATLAGGGEGGDGRVGGDRDGGGEGGCGEGGGAGAGATVTVGGCSTVMPRAAEASSAVAPRPETSVLCTTAAAVPAGTSMEAVSSTLPGVITMVTRDASTPASRATFAFSDDVSS